MLLTSRKLKSAQLKYQAGTYRKPERKQKKKKKGK
jgi:hypothetical protein